MRNVFLSLIIILTVCTGSHAGLFSQSVDFSDLAQLSSEGLQMLKEAEFAVFLEQVKVAGARSALKKAQGALKAAGTALKTKQSDVTAAESKHNETRENQDEKGTALAETILKEAERDLAREEMFRVWKQQEVKAGKATLKRAKLDLAIAEAERDMGRISRLKTEKVPAAANYSLEEIEKSLKKKHKERGNLKRAEEREVQMVQRLKEVYEQNAK